MADGKPLLVRAINVIAAHAVIPGEADPDARSRIYLSNGASLFVQEMPHDCVLDATEGNQ